MTTYLLDTNILSEPLKPEPNLRVLQRLEAEWSRCTVPAVVWHELVFGLENLGPSRRRDVISSWLFETIEPSFPIVAYGAAEAKWHAHARSHLKRRGRILPVIDGQVAATAATNELVPGHSEHARLRAVRAASDRKLVRLTDSLQMKTPPRAS